MDEPSPEQLARWPCVTLHRTTPWLAVSVSPNARRTAADGLHDGTLRVRLAAPPVDGKANELLVGWLADELGLPRRAVTLVRGQTAHRKWLALDLAWPALLRWLETLDLREPPSRRHTSSAPRGGRGNFGRPCVSS